MAFPLSPLGLRTEINLSGTTWTDISTFVMQRTGTSPPVSISRGRPDESSGVNASTMTLELNNRDGRFSVKNPAGPYFGLLGRNTPIRISVPEQSTYLRLETDNVSNASCPDSVSLHITGDLDVRIDLLVTHWGAPVLASKFGAGNAAWYLGLNTNGTPKFVWTTDGVTQQTLNGQLPVPVGRLTLRVTFQVAAGTVTFYTGPAGNADLSTGWTQLGGAVSTGSATSIFAATAPLVAGNWPSGANVGMQGSVYEMELRNGVGGTVVAHPVFTAQAAGATSFTDAQSNTWTLSGTAELSARSYRFHGEMSSDPVGWDASGKDVHVQLAAGGILRRLGQGNAPLMSPLKRATVAQAGTLAAVQYWPMEDLAGAAAFGSATGGPLMRINGAAQLASDSSFLCSNALPRLNNASFYGQVPRYTSNGSIIVRFLMNISTAPAVNAVLVRLIANGSAQEVQMYSAGNTTGLGFKGITQAGATLFDTGLVNFSGAPLPSPVWVSMELQPSGGNINYSLVLLAPGASTGFSASGSVAGTVGNCQAVYAGPNGDIGQVTIGHISVQSAWQSLFNLAQPLNAWQGEAAGSRFNRLCGENGIPCRIYGPQQTTVAMGAQSVSTLTALLQECETADKGQIFEPRRSYGLGYRTQASLLQQPALVTLDYSQAMLGYDSGTGLEPKYDDLLTRNDVVVTRSSTQSSGATFEYALNDGSQMSISPPPVGAGDYSTSLSVNVQYDTQLPDQAGWTVHLGTVDEARWPVVPINMARAAILNGPYYQVLAAEIGDFSGIINPPSQVPPDEIKELVWHVTEQLGGFHYRIEWAGVPESPYEIAILDDLVYGRADTDGSVLASSYDVAFTPAAAAWWRMSDVAGSGSATDWTGNGHTATATSVTFGQASTPVLGDTAASFNGTSSTALSSYNPAATAVTVDGWINPSTVSGSPRFIASSHTDADNKGFQFMLSSGKPQIWFGNGTVNGNAIASSAISTGAWTYVAATWNGTTITLYVNGVSAGTGSLSGSMAAGAATGIGLGYNPTYNGDFFSGLLSEFSVTLSALTGAQIAARYASAAGAYSPSATTLAVATTAPSGIPWTTAGGDLPFDIAVAGERMTVTAIPGSISPQAFTVTRSVNGVSKAQSAGAAVRLWFPPTLAMV